MCEKNRPVFDIETLMRKYGNEVLRTAYMYVRDYHLAEDIFQDVFLKVNQKLNTFQGDSSIKTWIIRIAINTCKDYLKCAYQRRVVPMMDYKEEALSCDDVYDKVEQSDRNEEIRSVVMSLPDKYREIVICVYYNGMSVSEAADVLHIAEGTAKSRLKRARDKMKTVLEGRV